jgi:Holliday junction resolvase
MASNYVRGRYTEYKAIKHLNKEGFFYVTRSPASKGMFDCVGVGFSGGILLQTKRTKRKKLVPSMYKEEMESIQNWVDSLDSLPEYIRVEFWVQRDGVKGWTKFRFYKNKPMEMYEGGID